MPDFSGSSSARPSATRTRASAISRNTRAPSCGRFLPTPASAARARISGSRSCATTCPDRIAWAKDVGLTQMMVPSLDGPKNPTMDDVKRAADEYNKMAEQSAKAGIQQGLHNETFELSQVNGRRTYDILLELLDPKLVKFQFQCSTISQGYDAAEYLTKYPGRFISMHVQDWSSETKKTMAVGQGSLDWKKIFTAAKTGGVKNYFVEMNLDLMKASVPYLKELNV